MDFIGIFDDKLIVGNRKINQPDTALSFTRFMIDLSKIN